MFLKDDFVELYFAAELLLSFRRRRPFSAYLRRLYTTRFY